MKTSTFLLRLLLLFAVISVFSSCRKDEEPTPTPAAVDSTSEPIEESPTPIPETPVEPEAVPTPHEDVQPEIQFDWSPQIIYSSLAPGEEVLLNGAITLRFDQPMDESSVEEALSVSISKDGDKVQGAVSWPRADTLVFTPEQNLERKQEYQVEVSEKARGRNGKPLSEPVALRLETVGFLEVSQVIPGDGTSEVQSEAALTVVFNRPVVPLVSTGQQEDLIQPLTFEPDTPGEGEWVSTSIYRFTPDEPLAGETRYQITIEEGLQDLTGGVLDSDFTWDFTTEGPDVVSTDPVDQEEDVDPSRPITVTFNMPMDRSSTEAATSLSPGSSVTYRWSDEDRVLSLLPDPMLDLETQYRLSVANSARSANGQAALARDLSYQFNTIAFPAILNTRPANGELVEQYQRGLQIIFASPMDMETLQDQLIISPEPENPVYYFNDYDFSLSVSFDLERNTDYAVTIPGSAADFYGNTLGDDYSWQFQTTGYPPMVSMNLPMGRSQLSTSYPTNVDIIHRNVSGFRAELRQALLPDYLLRTPGDDISSPVRTWSEGLETEQDVIGVHTLELADGGVLPTGAYVLTLSSSDITSENTWWQNHTNVIIVGDTNLIVKEMFGRVYVWATELATGQPAPGRSLTFYDREGRPLGSAITNEQGLADIDYQPLERYLSGVYVLSNNPGEAGFGVGSSDWSRGVSPWSFGVEATNSAETDRYAYLYTDRQIYRPGDTVHFKGIIRNNDFGRFPLPMNQSVILGLFYLTDYESIDYEFTTSVDENGEFDGEYVIPDDAPLGNYALNFDANDIQGSRHFTVAEYRKPEFQVVVTPEQDEVVRRDQVDVLIEASYFFGGAATDLPVSWTVYESDYRFPWDGPNYRFGDYAGFNFYWPTYGYSDESYVGDFVASGSGQTDDDGRFVIQLPADLLEDVAPGSRRITVEAEVQDVSDFPVTGQSEIVFHAADTYVGVTTDRWFTTAGTGTGVDVITVDWDGDPVPQQEVDLTLYRREWLPVRELNIGRYTTRWEVTDIEEDSAQVTTDAQGKASAVLVPNDGGSYLIVAETSDDSGRTHTSSTFLWVSSPNYVGWRVDPKDRQMDLTLDRDEYSPGDTARILVQSPFTGPVQAWLTVERGDLIEQKLITLETNSDVVDIPISENFAPNIFVTIHTVKGIDESNEFADMRIGMTELVVSPDHLGLNVTLTPQSDWFQPGETVYYDIKVTDHNGNPVQANLSLALVDLAVLSLMEDNAPDILEAFYARQPMRSNTGSGLIISGEGLEIEIPLEIGGMGGGGGGMDERSLKAIALDDDDNVRKDFPDTAFWRATVSTDANGQAEISIPLPDSLTTWRLSSKAVSEYATSAETLVGQNEDEIIATLPLLLRPITPRFFTVGDTLQLGAVVHNNTEEPIESSVTLAALGLTHEGEAEQSFTIPAGGRQVVQWPVTVNDVRFADLTFRVEGGGFSDASKPTFGIAPEQLLPVIRYSGEDLVGTSGVIDEAGRRVEAILLPENVDLSQGNVEINLNPSLAAAMLETLDYISRLEDRPACAHALTDQLLPNVATYQALELTGFEEPRLADELQEQIREDIVRLEELQQTLGGWSWCYSEHDDPILSAYALLSLAKAQEAGFTVSNDAIGKGARYLQRELGDTSDLTEPTEINRQAFFLYVLSEMNQASPDQLDELFAERRALLDPYAKGLLLMAFDNTGSSSSQKSTLIADLNDSVILSASGAHWEDAIPDWDNLASDIRGTAMIVNALTRTDPENPLIPNAVRWLMVARTADHWPTGQDNAWSLSALSEWMAASGELDIDYDYKVALNGRGLTQGHFGIDDAAESEQLAVAIGDLQPEEVNFIDLQRGTGDGRLYYTVHLDSFIDANDLEEVNRGIIVQRAYYDANCDPEENECEPISDIESGEQIRVELTMIVPNDLLYVVLHDPIPAGTEAIDPGLRTTGSSPGGTWTRTDPDYQYGFWGWWYFDRIEYRDNGVNFFSNYLPAGTYQFTYHLQSTIPGEYQVIPATARQEFFPDVFGRSQGLVFTINE